MPVDNFNDFKRQNFGRTDIIISNELGKDSEYWEVALDITTNMPLYTQSKNHMTSTTLVEVQALYESVKDYKGFYIARYEAGIDRQRTAENYKDEDGNIILETNVYSMMGKIPYTYIPWTKNDSLSEDTNGVVSVARNLYPETDANFGVVSTLTYGVQWDRTLTWWLEVEAKDGKGNTVASVINSRDYGNYINHVIESGDLNSGAKYAVNSSSGLDAYQTATTSSTKAEDTEWALTTGALKVASVNNIYDMAGNMLEWTMEGKYTGSRVLRGGAFCFNGIYVGAFCRGGCSPAGPEDSIGYRYGFRTALYIKN